MREANKYQSLSIPYSDEDYNDAKKLGLDLDDWNDYTRYFKLEEYAVEEE